jgi:DNA-binding GntR family transcriptional regulator
MSRVNPVALRLQELQEVAEDVRRSFLTAEEMAGRLIREAILEGVLRPGDRVPQEEIAAALGVSRMPVRRCLRPLEAEGLLDIRPYRGAVVIPIRVE